MWLMQGTGGLLRLEDAMSTCERCGHEVPDSVTTCPTCGTICTPRLVCDRCGRRIRPGEHSCMYCGYSYSPTPEGLGTPVAYGDVFQTSSPFAYAHGDSPAAWRGGGEAPHKRLIKGSWRLEALRLTDRVYLVALVLAISSAAFFWIPNLGVVLAGCALITTVYGYHRFIRHRNRYSGLWINALATVVALYGLMIGARWTII